MRIKIITLILAAAISFAPRIPAELTLKEAFKNDFLIGTALNPTQFCESNSAEASLVKAQFNSISPENVLKWEKVHPEPGHYDFTLADRYVAFGETNRMFIIGHNLVWQNQTPNWVFQDAPGKLVSRAVLLQRMREHIFTVVGRYKGRIKGWDVVNEALAGDGSLSKDSRWLKIIGPDYIEKAFQYAHEADPQAELYYNDYSIETGSKHTGALALIRQLQSNGIPIHAVGIQGHYNLNWPTNADLEKAIDDFAKLGVKVMITELDVDVLPSAWDVGNADITKNFQLQAKLNPYANGLPKDVEQRLADRYADLFRIFLKHRGDISRVTLWGVEDGDSWLNNWPVAGRTSYPLLFDRAGKPKLAFVLAPEQTPISPDSNGRIILTADTATLPGQNLKSEQPGGKSLPGREINADFNAVQGARSEVWRECIGAGRAAEGLRADWQRQLKLVQDEIGFRSIRFHGLLHDDMGVYSETKTGTPVYNWQYVDALYDELLALKLRPFVEFGFMPSALASGNKKMFWWNGNVTPPKSYAKWDGLIGGLVSHWTERYGADEVKQWNFEIWNEPNYPGFWGPRNPKRPREEYFELFAHTAAAVKKVNPAYRVGGPAGAGPAWVADQIAFCASNSVPLDFISYHAYGLGDGPSGLDQLGDRLLYLSGNLHSPADIANSQRAVIDHSARPGLPIQITEWSSSYSPRDPVHDSYFSAPYILEQLKQTEQGIASMSYWVFTDIFEENGPPPTPFHGGFGLLNLQGIKKPAYFAYQFLAQLGETELKNRDAASWICRDEKGGLQILLWDLTRVADETTANQEIFRKLIPAQPKNEIAITVTNLPPGNYRLQRWTVGFEKNDAYSAYLKLGAPSQLTREQEKELRAAAAGIPDADAAVSVGADGRFTQSLALRENDVLLLKLERE